MSAASESEASDGSPEVTAAARPVASEVTPERAESCPRSAETSAPGDVGTSAIDLRCFGFNQDCSHFIAGTSAGFRVFRTSPCIEALRREGLAALGDSPISVAAMKFKTPLFPMSACGQDGSAAGVLKLWDDKRGKFIGELRSRSDVRSVRVRNDIIAIICETGVSVYSWAPLKAVLSVPTVSNTRGVGALTSVSTPWVLCVPGEATGEVRVQVGLTDCMTFRAHEKAVAAITIDDTGSLIATASEFGSRVKVFKRDGAQLLYRFRLSSLGAGQDVTSLAFHPALRVLGVSCASDPNVFLFHCGGADAETGETPQRRGSSGFLGLVSSVVGTVAPEFMSDTFNVGTFVIPDVTREGLSGTDLRHPQAISSGPLLGFHPTQPLLWVLHHDGMLHEVELCPAEVGGKHCLETKLSASTMWFAARPDFQVTKPSLEPLSEDEAFGDQWHLV